MHGQTAAKVQLVFRRGIKVVINKRVLRHHFKGNFLRGHPGFYPQYYYIKKSKARSDQKGHKRREGPLKFIQNWAEVVVEWSAGLLSSPMT